MRTSSSTRSASGRATTSRSWLTALPNQSNSYRRASPPPSFFASPHDPTTRLVWRVALVRLLEQTLIVDLEGESFDDFKDRVVNGGKKIQVHVWRPPDEFNDELIFEELTLPRERRTAFLLKREVSAHRFCSSATIVRHRLAHPQRPPPLPPPLITGAARRAAAVVYHAESRGHFGGHRGCAPDGRFAGE